MNGDDDKACLSIQVAKGLPAALSQLAVETGDSEADLLLKSVALLVIALRAKKQGKQVVIAGDTAQPITGL